MSGNVSRTALILMMIVAVVTIDIFFFRQSRWTVERLAANIGIVLIFGAFYFRYHS